MLSSALKRHPKCAEYTTTLEYGSTNGVQLPRGVSTYSSTGNHVRTALRSSSPTYLPAHAERVFKKNLETRSNQVTMTTIFIVFETRF
jgi:hypothetical protein